MQSIISNHAVKMHIIMHDCMVIVLAVNIHIYIYIYDDETRILLNPFVGLLIGC